MRRAHWKKEVQRSLEDIALDEEAAPFYELTHDLMPWELSEPELSDLTRKGASGSIYEMSCYRF